MIYLDNAATSYPKPPEVIEAITKCLKEQGANPGRGAYPMALAASRVIFEAREALAELIEASDSADVIFTLNATDGLNLALKGLLRPGDHVITSSTEHNSVSRPLTALAEYGVQFEAARSAPDGTIDLDHLESLIRPGTRLIVTIHGSNVLGNILPVDRISEIAKRNSVLYLLDASQTVGTVPIDVGKLGPDVMAFSGHKGPLGPMGTGGVWIRPGLDLRELRQGGTGGESDSLSQPTHRPDRYECGTPNTPGIAGLGAGVRFLLERGMESVAAHKAALVGRFVDGLCSIDGVKVYGPGPSEPRLPVVSINIDGTDAHEAAFLLDKEYGIASRAGLHCCPTAHRVMGTLEIGALRFGLGLFNTENDVDVALGAVARIARGSAERAAGS